LRHYFGFICRAASLLLPLPAIPAAGFAGHTPFTAGLNTLSFCHLLRSHLRSFVHSRTFHTTLLHTTLHFTPVPTNSSSAFPGYAQFYLTRTFLHRLLVRLPRTPSAFIAHFCWVSSPFSLHATVHCAVGLHTARVPTPVPFARTRHRLPRCVYSPTFSTTASGYATFPEHCLHPHLPHQTSPSCVFTRYVLRFRDTYGRSAYRAAFHSAWFYTRYLPLHRARTGLYQFAHTGSLSVPPAYTTHRYTTLPTGLRLLRCLAGLPSGLVCRTCVTGLHAARTPPTRVTPHGLPFYVPPGFRRFHGFTAFCLLPLHINARATTHTRTFLAYLDTPHTAHFAIFWTR